MAFRVVLVIGFFAMTVGCQGEPRPETLSSSGGAVRKPDLLIAPFGEREIARARSAWSEYLDTPVEVTSRTTGMKLVLIPAGEYLMGSPEDEAGRFSDEAQHRVRLTECFWLGRTEVTQGEWESVMGTRPWEFEDYVKEGDRFAATYVSWEDAAEYCRRLSEQEGLSYRLPTESEWEYACRGGTQTAYSFGEDGSLLSKYGWFFGNADSVGESYAHEVGLKGSNAFGLWDMHGNVWEWCVDRAGAYEGGLSVDPRGPSEGSYRVYRGGSWFSDPRNCRSAYRYGNSPVYRDNDLGFRVALSSGVGR